MNFTETHSRCMMVRLRQVASARPHCKAWTWRLCRRGSALGRTDQEQEIHEIWSLLGLMEVSPDAAESTNLRLIS